MAKRLRRLPDDTPPKIRHAMDTTTLPSGSNGVARAQRSDLDKYLSDEPAPTASAPQPPPSDPAVRRGPTPNLNFHAEAWERLRESGTCLRALLQDEPRAIDLLSDFEEEVVKRTVGRGVIDRAMTEAARLDKAERKRRSETKRKVAYPSISGQAFDLLDRVPGYPDPGGG